MTFFSVKLEEKENGHLVPFYLLFIINTNNIINKLHLLFKGGYKEQRES